MRQGGSGVGRVWCWKQLIINPMIVKKELRDRTACAVRPDPWQRRPSRPTRTRSAQPPEHAMPSLAHRFINASYTSTIARSN